MSDEAEISPDLRRIDRIIIAAFTAAQDDIADVYAREARTQIEAVGAVRSGNLLNTTSAREAVTEGSLRVRNVESDAGYSDIVERGRKGNASGRGGYPGRFPFKRAIEQSESRVNGILDAAGASVQGA